MVLGNDFGVGVVVCLLFLVVVAVVAVVVVCNDEDWPSNCENVRFLAMSRP